MCEPARGRQEASEPADRRPRARYGLQTPRPEPIQQVRSIKRLHATVSDYLAHHHPRPATLAQAQAQHDAFRVHYNTVRPHQALDGATPAERYRPGVGQLLPVIELAPADHNPPGCLRRKTNTNGVFTYANRTFRLGDRWRGITIGVLRERGRLHVFYGHSLIETFLVGATLPTPTR